MQGLSANERSPTTRGGADEGPADARQPVGGRRPQRQPDASHQAAVPAATPKNGGPAARRPPAACASPPRPPEAACSKPPPRSRPLETGDETPAANRDGTPCRGGARAAAAAVAGRSARSRPEEVAAARRPAATTKSVGKTNRERAKICSSCDSTRTARAPETADPSLNRVPAVPGSGRRPRGRRPTGSATNGVGDLSSRRSLDPCAVSEPRRRQEAWAMASAVRKATDRRQAGCSDTGRRLSGGDAARGGAGGRRQTFVDRRRAATTHRLATRGGGNGAGGRRGTPRPSHRAPSRPAQEKAPQGGALRGFRGDAA